MRSVIIFLCLLTTGALVAQDPCDLSLVATLPSCPGEADGSLTVTGAPGLYTYLWWHDATLTGPTAPNLAAGPYEVVVSDTSGCVSFLEIFLMDPEVPPLGTLSTTPITCAGNNDGTVTFTLAPGLSNPWVWAHDASENSTTLTDLAPGGYGVIINNFPDCPSIIWIFIGEPEIMITGDPVYCPSAPPLLTAQPQWDFDPDLYVWSTGETTSSIQIEPGTEGMVEVTATDTTTGCVVVSQIFLTEMQGPDVTFDAPDSMCQALAFQVFTTTSNADSLVWRWENGQMSNAVDAVVMFSQPYWQPISLQGFDLLGCGNVAIQDSIYIHPLKPATFTVEQIPCAPVVEIDLKSLADSCAFFIGDSLVINECYGSHRLDLRRYQEYDFTFIATQVNMCNDTAITTLDVRTEPTMFLPTAFTPNGDGLNDEWPGMVDISDLGYELRVFDRWGVNHWATKDPLEKWDGGDLPVGMYIYTMRMRDPCELTNEVATKGYVMLVR